MNETLLRELVPAVIGILVRRGADFASAEDAVQEALVEAVRGWPDDPPEDPKGWLVTVAWRKFLDDTRSAASRRRREVAVELKVPPGPVPATDDTLWLYFLCAHPALSPASAVALTLRAVGGLTTRQIAAAYLVPEATMAQRISRAKRRISGGRLDRPGGRLDLHRQLPAAPRRLGAGRVEELAPRDRDEPALLVARRVVRPRVQCPDQRLLHGVLCGREVGAAPDEDTDHRGHQLPQQRLVHPVTR